MKPLAILLSLILLCCKSETKNEINSENGIDKSVYAMWNDFTESNPEFKKEELPESTYFHDKEADANRLAELIVNEKRKQVPIYIIGTKKLKRIYQKSEQKIL